MALPRRFFDTTADGMSGKMKLFPRSCQIAAQLCPRIGLQRSISLHLLLTAPPSSPHFHPFKKKRGKKEEKVNDNGFYLMFFLLSHFPICGPICQCHLCLTLRECSFTPANRVLLTTDDDVDRGDGLHECKFIYVAFQPPQPSSNTHVCNVIKTKLHFGPFTRSSLMCKFPIQFITPSICLISVFGLLPGLFYCWTGEKYVNIFSLILNYPDKFSVSGGNF